VLNDFKKTVSDAIFILIEKIEARVFSNPDPVFVPTRVKRCVHHVPRVFQAATHVCYMQDAHRWLSILETQPA
jgi:hypothetical protein